MSETLQELFVKSLGKPVRLDNRVVFQLCRIPINHGMVTISLLSPPNSDEGICIKAPNGAIELSDGTASETVYVWHEPNLPTRLSHHVNCPNGELLIWNIYRVHHPNGEVTVDFWTGNAGMTLLTDAPNRRRYACSDWRGSFDPPAIQFEVELQDDT